MQRNKQKGRLCATLSSFDPITTFVTKVKFQDSSAPMAIQRTGSVISFLIIFGNISGHDPQHSRSLSITVFRHKTR